MNVCYAYVQHVNGCIRFFHKIKIIFPQIVSGYGDHLPPASCVMSVSFNLSGQVSVSSLGSQSDSLANVRAGSESGLAGCVMPSVARFGLAAQLSFKNPLFEPVQPPSRASRASCQGRYIFRFQSCNFPEVGLM